MNINETHLKKWSTEECWGVVTEMLEARLHVVGGGGREAQYIASSLTMIT